MIDRNQRRTRIPRKSRHRLASAGAGVLLHLAVLAGLAGVSAQPARAIDRFPTDNGEITVRAVRQMSVVIEGPDGVIYTDPTGGGARYADHPAPDVILISHEHHGHYDARTLQELVRPQTRVVVPPYVFDNLPEGLRGNAVSLANGESARLGTIEVEAIAAYGLRGEVRLWHPQGRGNGYVVTVDGRRIYVAGSTDATPEMLELRDIYLAFLPLYPPYALGPDDAILAASTLRPNFAYIYQYNRIRTRDDFLGRGERELGDTIIIAPNIGP